MRLLLPRRLIVLTSLLCILFVTSPKQYQAQKIATRQPGVYLTFDKFVAQTVGSNPSQGARLVLHNNTRWPIVYGEWMEPAMVGDVALIYTVELENGCMGGRKHIDVVTGGKLLPGKSVSFTVPREDLVKGSAIFIEFNYSWEMVKGERVRDEVVHRSYFIISDLPRWPEKVLSPRIQQALGTDSP